MYREIVKRGLDFFFSLIGLVPFTVVLLIVGFMIHREDKGSVFYVAPRLGENGVVFRMFKFRTMKVDAPDLRMSDGSTFNGENDPRVTKVGRVLRKTSIDELPQLLNVIRGEMSFVGPRPDLPEAQALYSQVESRKLVVRPGITGYSQAYFRNSISMRDRFVQDLFYVEHVSFFLDAKIVLKTFMTVVGRKHVFINPASVEPGEIGGLVGSCPSSGRSCQDGKEER